MEEAIKKVLDLLEQGKISPEEAERLIRAIKEAEATKEQSKKETEKSERKAAGLGIVSEVLDEVFTGVGETVKTSIGSALEIALTHEKFHSKTFENIKELNIKVLGGDLEIEPSEDEKITASFEGKHRIDEDLLDLSIVKEGTLKVPQNVKINLSVLGGDVIIKGFYPEVNIDIKGGDVSGKIDFERLTCKVMGGDVEIKTEKKPLKMQVKALGGDVELPSEMKKSGEYYIFGEGNFREAEVKVMGGDFTLEFEEE
jgi:hypothetical protein